MSYFKLSWQSLKNRRLSATLTLLIIALSTTLLLSVDRIRLDVRHSFSNTISDTDLIVGARTGALNLLLYSVFRIGDASNNMSWQSYLKLQKKRNVKWTVPLSLGDSHRGYRVLGTSDAYFKHYKYANKQPLHLQSGTPFSNTFEVVLGSEVAKKLNYPLHQNIVLAHGTGATSFEKHDDKPFTVVGILAATGTEVDRTLHIPLSGMSALHVNWKDGVKKGRKVSAEDSLKYDLTPKSITAALVGLESKIDTFTVQRQINTDRREALSAIIPGATLQQLWQLIASAESALFVISSAVMGFSLLAMLSAIFAGLSQRRREIAIYRALGCPPAGIFWLLLSESAFYGILGTVLGLALHYAMLLVASAPVQALYGFTLQLVAPDQRMWLVLTLFVAGAVAAGLLPAYRAYRQTLNDGLKISL
ncbi:MAG: ABC transporter permease [Pseudomonadales bacterium]